MGYKTDRKEIKNSSREGKKIHTVYREQREDLKTGDREPDRERWRMQGIAGCAGKRGRN